MIVGLDESVGNLIAWFEANKNAMQCFVSG